VSGRFRNNERILDDSRKTESANVGRNHTAAIKRESRACGQESGVGAAMKKSCSTCRYGGEVTVKINDKDIVDEKQRVCRRFPPQMTAPNSAGFPVLPSHWVCGEHKPK
jgi:hypothetical protein